MTEPKVFTEEQVKAFVIKLKRKIRQIEEAQSFCQKHNFSLEAEAKNNERKLLAEITYTAENDFDLGFVWDKSLD